jgi:hypothetical protein
MLPAQADVASTLPTEQALAAAEIRESSQRWIQALTRV